MQRPLCVVRRRDHLASPFRPVGVEELSTRPRPAPLLLPREYAIDRLGYFTARVSGRLDPLAPARQRNYLKAISTLPEVDIHYGRTAVVAEFHTMGEKGSDVNLAAHLLNDVWKDLFEAAVVISNDTDLVLPISMVTEERKRSVFVVCPGRSQIAPQLRQVASYVRHIRPPMLRTAQLPDKLPGTGISKPAEW